MNSLLLHANNQTNIQGHANYPFGIYCNSEIVHIQDFHKKNFFRVNLLSKQLFIRELFVYLMHVSIIILHTVDQEILAGKIFHLLNFHHFIFDAMTTQRK